MQIFMPLSVSLSFLLWSPVLALLVLLLFEVSRLWPTWSSAFTILLRARQGLDPLADPSAPSRIRDTICVMARFLPASDIQSPRLLSCDFLASLVFLCLLPFLGRCLRETALARQILSLPFPRLPLMPLPSFLLFPPPSSCLSSPFS